MDSRWFDLGCCDTDVCSACARRKNNNNKIWTKCKHTREKYYNKMTREQEKQPTWLRQIIHCLADKLLKILGICLVSFGFDLRLEWKTKWKTCPCLNWANWTLFAHLRRIHWHNPCNFRFRLTNKVNSVVDFLFAALYRICESSDPILDFSHCFIGCWKKTDEDFYPATIQMGLPQLPYKLESIYIICLFDDITMSVANNCNKLFVIISSIHWIVLRRHSPLTEPLKREIIYWRVWITWL